MARSRQNQKESQPRLELLPVELQLSILQNLSSCEDLTSLIIASRSYNAAYLQYKKPILAQVTQATLGDLFVDACMLQHWQGNLNSYTEDEDGGVESSMLDQWQRDLGGHQSTEGEGDGFEPYHGVDTQQWPRGAYRHIQLKFLHDYDNQAMADAEDQAQYMQGLLTVEDFSQILSFHVRVVRPLSTLFAESFRVPRNGTSRYGVWETVPEAHIVTVTERQRIMQTLYRFQICCRLYAPKATPEEEATINLGHSHRLAMASDFFGRLDVLEIEEIQVVYRVMACELQEYFSLIRYDRDWFRVLRRRYWRAGNLRWFDYHPTTLEPVGLYGLTAGAISMGLGLLMRIESAAEPRAVVAILLASDPPQLSNFVWETLRGLREFHHFKPDWPESWSDKFWGIKECA